MDRFYTDLNLPLFDATRAGLKFFDDRAQADPTKGQLLLVAQSKGDFKTTFDEFPVKQFVKDLLAGKAYTHGNLTITLAVLTERVYGHNGPVLVIHPTAEQIETVEKIPGVTDILALTYMDGELADWATKNGAQKVV